MAGYIPYILIGGAGLLLAYFYNRFVRLKSMLQEGWSGIDVQLKRRHDLIPNLVETVKAYASHEQGTLEEISQLRSKAQQAMPLSERGSTESTISQDLKKIFVLAESYPELKADKNFRELQGALIKIEDDIQYARRYYNGTVRDLNIAVQSFPSNLAAKMFGFSAAEFFELELSTERATPEVGFASR